ncbi:MAG TPA: DUF6544 family protein [Symbiobacteriaceae bacterium]|nr:DUF6544 family protein [Symbiobacteriaceae bacterium]
MSLIAVIIAAVIAVVGLVFAGLHVRPRALAPFPPVPGSRFDYQPVPAGLPAPVARYYQAIMGDRVPVVRSAVLTGRGYLRLGGLRFPAAVRFTHDAGQGYRHYLAGHIFGRRLFQANEWYLDGRCRMELPVGVIENDAKTDAGAALGLWAESALLPSVFLTDPRVRWEPIDELHARLVVPSGDGTDTFTATFDPETGLLRSLEALRWKQPTSPAKLRWLAEVRDYRPVGGVLLPATLAATWEDEQSPWLHITMDEIVYNVDVTEYIRATGP